MGMARVDPRRERARANRRRIVEAAYRLFAERGYATSLSAIAAEAGAAIQTVQFIFHTKLTLLQEALAFAVRGDHELGSPTEQPYFRELQQEPDPRRALAIMVENTLPILDRVAPIAAIFQTLKDDPEAAEYWAHSEALRHEGFRSHIQVLASKGPLRTGVDEDEATDVLFALLSPGLYDTMVRARAWSPDRWQRWLIRTLSETLLPPESERSRSAESSAPL